MHEKARAGVSTYGPPFSPRGTKASLIYSNLQEMDEAKQAVGDLEGDLKAEHSHPQVLPVEQTRASREKDNVSLQPRRPEPDMEDVRLQLQRVKRNNNELEAARTHLNLWIRFCPSGSRRPP